VSSSRSPLGRVEFTALLAMSMALAALGIDMMLPVFPDIRASLGLAEDSNAVAGLITAYFVGLASGQLVYGPLADRFGRRFALYLGYTIYALGALGAVLAPTLELLLVTRLVWGLGASGPRVVTLAVIRDRYDGELMSRAMSFVMAVFVLVPVLAPTLGALIASVASWRWVFGACVVAVAVMAVWATRLPETLREEHRRPLRFRPLVAGARIVVSDRRTVGYSLAMTSLYGVFTSYIASSEIVFAEVFDAGDTFPLIFGGIAGLMGLAMLANAAVVRRVGTRRLAHGVLMAYLAGAVVLVAVVTVADGRPSLGVFLPLLAVMVVGHALLIPNLNTIAMQPMAAVAGTASSVIGAVQIGVGAALGSLLDRAFDGTVGPLSLGFLGYGVLALALVLWAERGRLFQPLVRAAPRDP
jgi:DHA1 family bicyclomycin/chloramphenicol resistance-like MFS transporter